MSDHNDTANTPVPLIQSITRKKRRNPKSCTSRHLSYEVRRKERLDRISAEVLSAELEHCTFSPSVSRGASKRTLSEFLKEQEVYERNKQRKLKEQREVQKSLKEMHETSTHHPSICKKSQSLSRHGKSVYEQLYESTYKPSPSTYEFDFMPSVNLHSKSMMREDSVDVLLYNDALRRQQKQPRYEEFPKFTQSQKSKQILVNKLRKEVSSEFNKLTHENTLNYMKFCVLLENCGFIRNYEESKDIAIEAWNLISDGSSLSKQDLIDFLLFVMNLATPEHPKSIQFEEVHSYFIHFYQEKTSFNYKKEVFEEHSFRPEILEESERLAEIVRNKRIEEFGSASIEDVNKKKTLEKLEMMRIANREKEVEGCTFKPEINEMSPRNRKNSNLYKVKVNYFDQSSTSEHLKLQESLKECYFQPRLGNQTVKTIPKKQMIEELVDRLSQPKNPYSPKSQLKDKPVSNTYSKSDYFSPRTLVKRLINRKTSKSQKGLEIIKEEDQMIEQTVKANNKRKKSSVDIAKPVESNIDNIEDREKENKKNEDLATDKLEQSEINDKETNNQNEKKDAPCEVMEQKEEDKDKEDSAIAQKELKENIEESKQKDLENQKEIPTNSIENPEINLQNRDLSADKFTKEEDLSNSSNPPSDSLAKQQENAIEEIKSNPEEGVQPEIHRDSNPKIQGDADSKDQFVNEGSKIEQQEVKTEQEEAKTEQEVKTEQEEVKKEQEEVKTEQEDAKTEQEEAKMEQEVKPEQEEVKKEQEEVKTEQEEAKTEQQEVKTEQEETKTEQQEAKTEQEDKNIKIGHLVSEEEKEAEEKANDSKRDENTIKPEELKDEINKPIEKESNVSVADSNPMEESGKGEEIVENSLVISEDKKEETIAKDWLDENRKEEDEGGAVEPRCS